jgi:trans-aconitate 2-methyltransferase
MNEAAASVAREEPFEHYFKDWHGAWNFATPEETERRLHAAGFEDVRCWLEPRPVHPPEPRTFIEVVCIAHHLDLLPQELRAPYADRVFTRAGGENLQLNYVRLNIEATRPA